MLKVTALQKSFDGFLAVCDARLNVARGEITAVIGPNGAGKTTLFHLITGQIRPDKGSILFKDREIAGLSPFKVCRLGISRSYQVVNVFDRLSIFENVRVAVLSRRHHSFRLFSNGRRAAAGETWKILETMGLDKKSYHIAGTLSHGDRKVLEIAVALGNQPELLILDEPTAGMSPEETDMVLRLMRRLRDEMGITLVFCEHDMEMVFSLSDRIMVMQHGKTLIQNTPDVVKNHPEVQSAYLGEIEC